MEDIKINIVNASDGSVVLEQTSKREMTAINIRAEIQNIQAQKDHLCLQLEDIKSRYKSMTEMEKVYKQALAKLEGDQGPEFTLGV